MTGEAGRVIDLRTRHGGRDGLRLGDCFGNGCAGLLLFAGQINVADGTNALGHGGLVFGRFTLVNVLRPLRHLHREHEDRDREHYENANDEGVHIKEFLVPTQGIAPDLV